MANYRDPTLRTHLGELGLRFGMERGRVETIEDEQDLTNFIILVDYITGLWQTWIAQRPYFNRLANPIYQPYFGTQLVLVSRALAVVGEAVDEVNFTMDSVFLGPAERQTLQLNYCTDPVIGTPPPAINIPYYPVVPSSAQNTALLQGTVVPQPGQPLKFQFLPFTSPMFIAELLDWINRVATEEGPRLIQDSGKDGVVALNPTIDNLRTFRAVVHSYSRAACNSLSLGCREGLLHAPGPAADPRAGRLARRGA